MVPGRFSMVPGRFSMVPGRFLTVPGWFLTVPGRFLTVPGWFLTVPGWFLTVPGWFSMVPRRFSMVPGRFSMVPGRFSTVPEWFSTVLNPVTFFSPVARCLFPVTFFKPVARSLLPSSPHFLANAKLQIYLLKGDCKMSITLPPELEQFIQSQVASGKYASVDEVFLAGIKLLEERERLYQGRFEELRREILVGVKEAEAGELLEAKAVINGLQEKLQQRRRSGYQ
jgi:antitoxin ParD1/3/4